MPEYRVYILDQNNQVAAEPVSLDCADGNTAVANATKFAKGNTIEVWSSTRRVAHIPAVHALLRDLKASHNNEVYIKRAAECLALCDHAPKALWPALIGLSDNWKKMATPSLSRTLWKLFKPK